MKQRMELTFKDDTGHPFTVGIDVADAPAHVDARLVVSLVATLVGGRMAKLADAAFTHMRGPFEVPDHV